MLKVTEMARELKKETVDGGRIEGKTGGFGEGGCGTARRSLRGSAAAAASATELRRKSGADLIGGDGEKLDIGRSCRGLVAARQVNRVAGPPPG